MNDENEKGPLHTLQGVEAQEDGAEDSVSLETGRPAVASAPAKVMVFLLIGLVCVGIVVKSLFFSEAGPVVENKVKKQKEKVVAGEGTKNLGASGAGDLPIPPAVEPITNFKSEEPSGAGGATVGKGPDLTKLPPPPVQSAVNLPPVTMGGAAVPNVPSLPVITAPVISAPVISAPAQIAPAPPPLISAAPPAIEGGAKTTTQAPPPPPPPGLASPPVPEVRASLPKDEKALARIKGDSTVLGGAAMPAQAPAQSKKTSTGFVGGGDSNSQFANAVTSADHDKSTTAKRINNLEYILIQGKIIYGVLETAISSDLPGTLRAVVSHDVYAEAGRAILIPKGSRLIGTYSTAVKKGQGRVFIIWTRVIRPDGVSIDVDSPGIDNLGRSGADGDVDNHYTEMFSTAILTSSLDIGIAAIGQALFGSDQSSTTTNSGTGGTTTSSSATGTSMQSAVESIGSVGKQIVSTTLATTPTVTVDQGTPVNIFVNQEMEFPPNVTGGLSVIQ